VEVVPADPVIRAVGRIPVKSYAVSLARGSILSRYHQDLKELRQSYIARADSLVAQLTKAGEAPPQRGP